jgi:hypothetical protein
MLGPATPGHDARSAPSPRIVDSMPVVWFVVRGFWNANGVATDQALLMLGGAITGPLALFLYTRRQKPMRDVVA